MPQPLSPAERGDVELIVRHNLYETQEATLRQMTANWRPEHFMHALDCLRSLATDRQVAMAPIYRNLLTRCEENAARANAEAVTRRRHDEITTRLAELKRPHWTVLPNFWLTLVSALAAIVAAVCAAIALKGHGPR